MKLEHVISVFGAQAELSKVYTLTKVPFILQTWLDERCCNWAQISPLALGLFIHHFLCGF